MGKDKVGTYHPPKGKPSGVGKEKGIKVPPTDPEALEEYLEIEDKYTGESSGDVASNVHVRHPNRNVDKKANRKDEKDNESKSRNQTYTEEMANTLPEELPGNLSKNVFVELANYKSSCCVTVYLETHPSGVAVNEKYDTISFKNVLQNITTLLRDRGIDQATIVKMLEPGYELLRNDAFWLNLSPGLAVFLADGYFKYVRTPLVPKDEIFINTSFYISPLIPVMTSNEHFYLLVISKKQSKLYRADAFGMEYIPIPELPNGVDDVVHFEEKEDENLFRTGGRGSTGGANFHGIGAGKPDEKKNIALYLEEVDRTLWKTLLNREHVPLLLAGVEYLIPIYKQVSAYKFIWEEPLTGSHEHDEIHALYEKAKEKMTSYFQARTMKALINFGNHSATELTSSIPADVIPAAHYGRISHLFVQKDEHIWGTFDEHANELKLHETQHPEDECLLNKAIVKTILTGGEVHLLDKEQMPVSSSIAALMRY